MIPIQVIGEGDALCKKLYQQVKLATFALELPIEVEYSTDTELLKARGILQWPALLLDNKVAYFGGTPGLDELKRLISDYRWLSHNPHLLKKSKKKFNKLPSH